jgi:hypothetical protein
MLSCPMGGMKSTGLGIDRPAGRGQPNTLPHSYARRGGFVVRFRGAVRQPGSSWITSGAFFGLSSFYPHSPRQDARNAFLGRPPLRFGRIDRGRRWLAASQEPAGDEQHRLAQDDVEHEPAFSIRGLSIASSRPVGRHLLHLRGPCASCRPIPPSPHTRRKCTRSRRPA